MLLASRVHARTREAFQLTFVRAILFGLSAVAKSTRHHSKAHDDDPRAYLEDILGKWGKPGSGTEGIAQYPTDFTRDIIPIPCHSHNDYWRRVPLFSAINAGCIGVEADVWLYDEELYVGHDTASLQPNRTFRSLYIDPLVKILEAQNPSTQFYNGSENGVFDTNPYQTLVLLVDLKTPGKETWPFVVKQLEPLRRGGWLSRFEDGKAQIGPITVVGTGTTPLGQVVANSTFRDTFFDAPLNKIEGGKYDSTNSYYASVSFPAAVGKIERGELSADQISKIRKHVKAAHDKGLKARYWDLPGWPIRLRNHVWEVLIREGVDILNVDDIEAVATQDW